MPARPEKPIRGARARGPQRKRPSFWGRLGVIAIIPFVLYASYTVVEKSVQTYRLKQTATVISAEIEAEKRENLLLQQDIADARGESQVEDAARRELNLVRPGDNPVVLVSTIPRPTLTARPMATPEVHEESPGWLVWLFERLGL